MMTKIVLQTAYWNESTQSFSSLATETRFLYAEITAEFNRPAKASIVLGDATGTIAQKYDVDTTSHQIYVGSGRAYLYDDDDAGDASIFNGRIMRVVSNMDTHTVTLECEDYLSQLHDRREVYDMREDLDGNGLRQSELKTDPDNGNALYVFPVFSDGATYLVADDDMDWAADQWNGYYIAFPSSMHGPITIAEGPFTKLTDGADTENLDDFPTCWLKNNVYDVTSDNGGDFEVYHYFDITCMVAALGDLVDSDTITDMRMTIIYKSNATSLLWGIYHGFDYVYMFDDLKCDATPHQITLHIPPEAWADLFDFSFVTSKFDVETNGGDTYVHVDYLWFEVDVTATGYSSPDLIIDTVNYDGESDKVINLQTTTNFAAQAQRLWEGVPYSICRPIYKHIDTAEDGTLVTEPLYRSLDGAKMLDGAVYTDELTDINDADTDDVIILPDPLAHYDGFLFGFSVPFNKMKIILSTQGDYDGTLTWKYWSGAAWSNLSSVTDGTTGFEAVPGTYSVTWAMPTDWEKSTVDGSELYWVKVEMITALPSITTQPKVTQAWVHEDMLSGRTNGAGIITAAANIEHTSGISLRHYEERTRLEILQDLSIQDKAVFWLPLGSVALTWKSTFNNGSPTAMTDASVLAWTQADWNFPSLFNEYHVYGVRTGDIQTYAEDVDATSQSTYAVTRTNLVKGTGVQTDYECTQLAEKLVARDKDIDLLLQAEIGGLSSLRLGDEVSITSSYLGLTTANYVITHWRFDTQQYRTIIRLLPRAAISTIGLTVTQDFSIMRTIQEKQRLLEADVYPSDLHTQEWSN